METDTLEDLREVAGHMERIAQGVRNLRELPLWVQASRGFLTYNPEAVLYQVQRWRDRLDTSDDEEGRLVAIILAAHRIHRFGAGPSINEEIWTHVVDAVGRLEHPEDLAEGLETTALEPTYYSHTGHQRGMWPIRLLPEQFYARRDQRA